MVSVSHLAVFAALSAALIAVPGPSVLFTVSRALTVGRRTALITLAGNELGLCVQVVAVAFGAGAVVERSAEVFMAVTWVGAVYISYLGVQAIRHRRSMAEALAVAAGTARQWFTRSPRRLAMIGGTGGLVMIGLGVSLAATGRKN